MELFVDSDFGGDVCWCLCDVSIRTQKSVALSSTKAEYVAMADGMKEAIFLQYLWSFIFPDRDVGCTLIHEDNVSAIHLACNPATTPTRSTSTSVTTSSVSV